MLLKQNMLKPSYNAACFALAMDRVCQLIMNLQGQLKVDVNSAAIAFKTHLMMTEIPEAPTFFI